MRRFRYYSIITMLLALVSALLLWCVVDTDQKVQDLQDKIDSVRNSTKNVYVFGESIKHWEPDTEVVQVGYDFDMVCRVVTAEAGTDRDLCMAVAQCLFNSCCREEWKYPPTQILEQYGYTEPADWISETAREACQAIFEKGEKYYPVQNAEYFYAPQYVSSEWHESQEFITEIGGVRFFERR